MNREGENRTGIRKKSRKDRRRDKEQKRKQKRMAITEKKIKNNQKKKENL